MNHVLHLSVIMIIVVSIHIPESLCVNDAQFSNCSASYKCGSKEITYPFYGASNRPEYCGYPGFKAACVNESILMVNISSLTYRVLAMDYSSETLTVARDDYWENYCPKYLYNTTLDFNLFSYGLNYQNLSLYYNCPATLMPTTYQFTCATNQTRATGYYLTSAADQSTFGSTVIGCNDSVLVPVFNTGADFLTTSPTTVSNLQTVINEGFGLVWKANNSRCGVCAGSDGQAVGSGDFACYCSDKPYGSECGLSSTGPEPSSIPVKLILAFTAPVGVIIVGSLILMVFMKKSGHDHSLDEFIRNYGSLAPKQYSYTDIKKITNSFANKLGLGGYGRVYKGKLSDGRPVAVKIFNESKGNGEGFLNEVASICRTSTNYFFSIWDQLNLDIHLSILQLQPPQNLPTPKMYGVLPFSSLLFITFFFSLTNNIHPSSSYEIDPPLYPSCDKLLSCGKIRDVDYPFWVEDPFWDVDRTYECGYPEFKIDCTADEVAIIEIMNVGYRVLEMNSKTNILRVARHDFDNGTCTSNFVSTTINQTLFEYTDGYTNITILYGCPPFSIAGYNLPLCYTNFTVDVVIGTRGPGACNKSVTVPVPDARMELLKRTNFSGLGNVIRDDGFEVKWKADRKCDECRRKGGKCGYDLLLSQLTCITRSSSIPVRLILAFAVPFGVIIFGSMIFCGFKRKSFRRIFASKSVPDHDLDEFIKNYGSFAPKQYNYSDVKKITNSFANKLGQGGYGCVFKGKLSDGRLVAVKILSESKGNGQEFLNEVASISRTSHVNVVSLLGFCCKGTKRALIYEFMPNISLDKFLYKGKSSSNTNLELDRAALFKIAIGIARGLEYLHSGCNTRILHLDIKPHNILLDQDWCPKISDFGLAKLCLRKESVISTMGARGTIGYIAPEVFNRGFGRVSYKSDVYSYGMMILEMAGVGKQAEPEGLTETSEMYFPDWIYKRLEAGSESVPLRDDGVMGDEKNKEMERKMIIVGLWCIQTKPADRPSITGVIEMLEGSSDLQQAPPKPILFPPTSRSPRHYSSSSLSSSMSQIIDIQS